MRMKAVFNCSADETGELSFKEGDVLVDVTDSGEEGWYNGRIENTLEFGLFPYNYVTEIPNLLDTKKEINNPTKSEIKNTTPVLSSNVIKTALNNSTKEDILPGFPALDAFEAAMSGSKGSKASTMPNWTPSMPTKGANSPPKASPKPVISSVSSAANLKKNTDDSTGLGIKTISSSTFEKPQLRSVGLRQESSPTRLRSHSTSSVSRKEPTESDKPLRPSQLLQDKGTKSALELALGKGPSISPLKLRSNSVPKHEIHSNGTSGIPLVGMRNLKPEITMSHDVEEEDGFQMVKPSQLQNKQQFPILAPKPVNSQSSTTLSAFHKSSVSTAPSWKKKSDEPPVISSNKFITPSLASKSGLENTTFTNKKNTSSSVTNEPSTTKLGDFLAPNNPMPRLPSRPASATSRRSRNSRASSTNVASSASANNTPSDRKAPLPPLRETLSATAINDRSTPPLLKPKPQIHGNLNLSPKPKIRSSSNPPPVQPKPALSSIEILLSRDNTSTSRASNSPSKLNKASPTFTTPIISANKQDASSLYQPKQQPKQFPGENRDESKVVSPGYSKTSSTTSRPNLDKWHSTSSANSNDFTSDANIKPSALLNRTRSATNPTTSNNDNHNSSNNSSSNNNRTFVDWSALQSIKPTIEKSAVTAPKTEALIEQHKKVAPPPPPSRPPKNFSIGKSTDPKIRYETLFDTINDDGYIDGETVHLIWLKSKISNEELARIWRECDPDHKGLLDKHAFIDGMSRIDQILLKQQQVAM